MICRLQGTFDGVHARSFDVPPQWDRYVRRQPEHIDVNKTSYASARIFPKSLKMKNTRGIPEIAEKDFSTYLFAPHGALGFQPRRLFPQVFTFTYVLFIDLEMIPSAQDQAFFICYLSRSWFGGKLIICSYCQSPPSCIFRTAKRLSENSQHAIRVLIPISTNTYKLSITNHCEQSFYTIT